MTKSKLVSYINECIDEYINEGLFKHNSQYTRVINMAVDMIKDKLLSDIPMIEESRIIANGVFLEYFKVNKNTAKNYIMTSYKSKDKTNKTISKIYKLKDLIISNPEDNPGFDKWYNYIKSNLNDKDDDEIIIQSQFTSKLQLYHIKSGKFLVDSKYEYFDPKYIKIYTIEELRKKGNEILSNKENKELLENKLK